MNELQRHCGQYVIDWNLTPEHAVTMYLEFGNNDWNAEYPPVRSRADYATYFVVDTWQQPPLVRLVRRNSDGATDVFTMPLPEELRQEFAAEYGTLKGVFAPTPPIKRWLQAELARD